MAERLIFYGMNTTGVAELLHTVLSSLSGTVIPVLRNGR
jgi:hypothetical protein